MTSRKIPKVKPDSWLLGSIKSYKEDTLGFLHKNAEHYGDIYQFRTAHKRINVLNRPEYIQHVLQKNQRNYQRHFAYRILKNLVGDSVISLDGEKWKEARRMMQPHFHKKNIESYFSIINEFSKKAIHEFSEKKEIWLLSEMTKLTLDIISTCFLGGGVSNSAEVVEKNLPAALEIILNRIQSPIQPPLWFPTKTHKSFRQCIHNLDELINEIIAKKEAEKDFTGTDLITMYLLLEKNGESITRQQIFDEIITIFTAGHETTANALFSLVKDINEYKYVKEKVTKEYETVTNGETLKLEHLSKLTYTNKVINESLRLSTPIWAIGREALRDDVVDGYTLKKGETILISPYLIHRNPDLWPDPEKFDPDRFDQPLVHKYAYFPFGGGPKLCIGMGLALMEMQVILYHIIKSNYEIKSKSIEKIKFETSLTLKVKTDVPLVKSIKQLTPEMETAN